MKVIVLGAGVIGVTTAFELASNGCEVTVVDRQPGVALETSYANAGEVSPGYASPWAGPTVPFKAIRWLLMKHGPLVIRPKLDPRMWSWALQMLRNCTSHRYSENKARMVRLAEYSRDCLVALRKETGLQYDERSCGTLQLFRNQKQTAGAADDVAVLKQFGVPFELLDADGCVRVEPALAAVRDKIAGGLRLPADETGDCYLFTQGLAKLAENRGVTFRFETDIHGWSADGMRVACVATSAGELKADAYVVALGSYSPLLVASLGLRLPVYPVKGYSITVPIVEPCQAPVSTVMDETYKVAITRLGDRIRVGGTAELAGYDRNLDPERQLTLEHSLNDLFPHGADLSVSTFWTGLRPMTPDGTPVIGKTPYANLYFNTGHGTLGWTMACGSARVLSDLILDRSAEIKVDDFAFARYQTN